MAKIIIKRNINKFTHALEIRSMGKAGRRERMFEVNRRVKKLLNFAQKTSKVERVLQNLSTTYCRKLEDIPRKRYYQAAILTANAKQKRTRGHRDLV